MKYAASVVDVHDEHHHLIDPIEAGTPWEAFEYVLRWARQNAVMPAAIYVDKDET